MQTQKFKSNNLETVYLKQYKKQIKIKRLLYIVMRFCCIIHNKDHVNSFLKLLIIKINMRLSQKIKSVLF